MKNYRIKNYFNRGYIVQERYWIFFWATMLEDYYHSFPKRFKSIDEARSYVNEIKEAKENIKRASYTEYV